MNALQRRSYRLSCRTLVPLAAAVFLAACAVDGSGRGAGTAGPAQVFGGEPADRQVHEAVLQRYGRYDNEALQGFIQRTGEQLVARSLGTDQVYRFTILDSGEVNAFALTPGHVYVTRGLLALLDSEAQLAAVLAHEIAHLSLAHPLSRSTAAVFRGQGDHVQPGLNPAVGSYGSGSGAAELVEAALAGRATDDELEAYGLGARYVAESGYDPAAVMEVIIALDRHGQFESRLAMEQRRAPRVFHGLSAVHAAGEAHVRERIAAARNLQSDAVRRVHRDQYLNAIEGLVFGDSETQGVRRGARLLHKSLGYTINFPRGWYVDNRPDRTVAVSPGQDALMQLIMLERTAGASAKDFLQSYLGPQPLRDGRRLALKSLEGYTATADLSTPFGIRPARFAIIYLDDKAYILAGAVRATAPAARHDEILGSMESFRRLSARERSAAAPLRIETITAGKETTLADLVRQSALSSHAEEQLRILNQLYPTDIPEPGYKLKVVK